MEYGPLVFRVCRAMLALHDAEDAAAETFLAALAAYPRLRPDSDVRAWLITIAHRKAVDVIRTVSRGPVPFAQTPERPIDDEMVLPDEPLWAAVRALPHKQRYAVAYHYVADLPYNKVGALIGSSETAARRSGADGIKALRRAYPRTASGQPPDTSTSARD
jgi:RNA polymerase sigma factor (sigma-70 family)